MRWTAVVLSRGSGWTLVVWKATCPMSAGEKQLKIKDFEWFGWLLTYLPNALNLLSTGSWNADVDNSPLRWSGPRNDRKVQLISFHPPWHRRRFWSSGWALSLHLSWLAPQITNFTTRFGYCGNPTMRLCQPLFVVQFKMFKVGPFFW